MHKHRLDRLARLTQGVALLGFGVGSLAACNNDPKHINSPDPNEPIHVNATAEPTGSTAPSAPTPSASTPPAGTGSPVGMNGPTTPTPSASASGSAAPKPTTPPHINSPAPTAPKHTNG